MSAARSPLKDTIGRGRRPIDGEVEAAVRELTQGRGSQMTGRRQVLFIQGGGAGTHDELGDVATLIRTLRTSP